MKRHLRHALNPFDIGKVKTADPEHFMLLMGSYHESKMMTLKQELKMYRLIILNYAKKGGLIILKSHPSSDKRKTVALSKILKRRNFTCEIYPKSAIPIELLVDSTTSLTIISLSYSSVTLKYLYKLKIIHALDNIIIDKFFKEEFKFWLRSNNDLYLNQISMLD
jgi:hypothetical protein